MTLVILHDDKTPPLLSRVPAGDARREDNLRHLIPARARELAA